MAGRSLRETNRILASALSQNGYTPRIIARWLGIPVERVPDVLRDAADHAEEGKIIIPGSLHSLRRTASRARPD